MHIKRFFFFVALVVFAIILVNVVVKHTPQASQSSAESSSGQPPAQTVSAERLFLDYQQNEISADSIYKGRTLAVTGTVSSINKDFTDSAFLMLETSNEFMGVHAGLRDSEVSKASGLSKGQVITVVCEGHGMIIGSPMLKDCVIQPEQQKSVEIPKPPASNPETIPPERSQQQPLRDSQSSAYTPDSQEQPFDMAALTRALENWAKANESNDPTLLANCYAEQVDRFFLRTNVTNTFVHDYWDTWFKEHDSRVTMFKIKDATFENKATATVTLRLDEEVVTTSSRGAVERLIPAQLSLKKIGGEWMITSERDFK